ncbi:16S rRNA (guanine(966)-N(2))-methyltransferase RsmD [uncultured Muribaculum sp.]|uniref:16S rRNA (guanine(966)-N(2))-methyltransferase RsmD n=1 Tax=uncultured Muribaculum sp. TaxID=1918613 RepID=UPI0025B0F30E|nr:16S rRNA (guanine(966)-N(2))-methyltransferase RsmD [uncultured Muribaculum sp.]
MRIIRGKYGRRRFNVPTNISARPTTDFARENIFNVIENLAEIEGAEVLDLFAGTGAISIEFLSRECATVTSVEKAATQWRFIDQVARQLNIGNMNLVRGDVFRFISSCKQTFDIIFADPPYTLPNLGDIPALILESKMVKPGTLVVVEHSKAYDFSQLPGFFDRRVYGSVNFSLFRVGMP